MKDQVIHLSYRVFEEDQIIFKNRGAPMGAPLLFYRLSFFSSIKGLKEHKEKLLSFSVIAQAEPEVSLISSKVWKRHKMCQ